MRSTRATLTGLATTAIAGAALLIPSPAFAAIYGSENPTGGAQAVLNTNTGSNWLVVCDAEADSHRAVYQLSNNPSAGTVSLRVEAVGNSHCTDTHITTMSGTRTRYQRACLSDGANSRVFSCSGWKKVVLD